MRILLLVIALAVPTVGLGAQATAGIPKDRNILVAEEIRVRAVDAKTAYDAIHQLRPQFLRERPSGSMFSKDPVPIKVYVDGGLRGSVGVLKDITATSVVDVVYLSGVDATTRFGANHENGAIMVRTGKTP